MAKRILYILKNENIKLNDEQKRDVVLLIKKLYPDFRKIINEIQKHCLGGELKIPNIAINNELVLKIIEFIKTKRSNIGRKYWIENEDKFQGDYVSLLRDLFNYINDNLNYNFEKSKKALLVVSEHLYRSSFVVDQEINFYSCCIGLEELLSA